MKRLGLWLMCMLLPLNGFAANYALLVGIETYQQSGINALPGCANDVELMRRALAEKFGVPAEHIEVVLNSQATFAGIEAAFRRVSERAQPGDVVTFYYSGHGTQVPDDNGDEADGVDEALCPTDISSDNPSSWLRDDTLAAWLAQLRTDKVTVILDSCFSGTATRADDEPLRVKFADFGFRPTQGAGKVAFFEKDAGGHLLLSAGTADQVSYMLKEDGKGSVFTAFLYDVLVSVATDTTYDFVISQVAPSVQAYVSQYFDGNEQTPQLEGNGETPLFFAASEPAPQPTPADAQADALMNRRDFGLKIALNQALYYDGDVMTVTVEAERDCYLRMYVMNAEGKTTQLFPNKWQQEHFIKAGQTVQIPGERAKFRLRMKAPFGKETICAVAKTTPFSDDDLLTGKQSFLTFGAEPLNKVATRGVEAEGLDEQPEISVATAQYEIKPR